MRLEVEDAAREELRHAFYWYGGPGSPQAEAFADRFDALTGRLLSMPFVGAPYFAGTRRLMFLTFPYALIYRVVSDDVIVVAIAHTSREPGYWSERS
ncbi:MAG: type II toxin-antitoxin system RelE/ParE family toxin [Chloroflexi bacterium]|nr:type II toxin-antitoxin system RelE/ParE family toxin [Chloroflexota bacterium]